MVHSSTNIFVTFILYLCDGTVHNPLTNNIAASNTFSHFNKLYCNVKLCYRSITFCRLLFERHCSINWIYSTFNTCNSHCHSIIKLWVWTRLSTEYHAMVILLVLFASFLRCVSRFVWLSWPLFSHFRSFCVGGMFAVATICDSRYRHGIDKFIDTFASSILFLLISVQMCWTEIHIYCVHPCGANMCYLLYSVALWMNSLFYLVYRLFALPVYRRCIQFIWHMLFQLTL